MRKASASGSSWLIVIAIIAGYIIANQLYLTYKTVPISDPNVYCENDQVKLHQNMFGMGEFSFNLQASVSCSDYKTSRCKVACDNNNVVCKCESTLLDQLLSHPGEWILGRTVQENK